MVSVVVEDEEGFWVGCSNEFCDVALHIWKPTLEHTKQILHSEE